MAEDGQITEAPPPARRDLPVIMDIKAAPALLEMLNGLRGQALSLDAARVQRLATPCLQVLIAARRGWNADGRAWDIATPSEAFIAAAELIGAAALLRPAGCGQGPAA